MRHKLYVLVEIDGDWQRSEAEEARWVREALQQDPTFCGELIRSVGVGTAVRKAEKHSALADATNELEF